MDYSRNIKDVGIVLNNKILNYVGIMHEMKGVDHMKYIWLQNVGYMKYTTNSNRFIYILNYKWMKIILLKIN